MSQENPSQGSGCDEGVINEAAKPAAGIAADPIANCWPPRCSEGAGATGTLGIPGAAWHWGPWQSQGRCDVRAGRLRSSAVRTLASPRTASSKLAGR